MRESMCCVDHVVQFFGHKARQYICIYRPRTTHSSRANCCRARQLFCLGIMRMCTDNMSLLDARNLVSTRAVCTIGDRVTDSKRFLFDDLAGFSDSDDTECLACCSYGQAAIAHLHDHSVASRECGLTCWHSVHWRVDALHE